MASDPAAKATGPSEARFVARAQTAEDLLRTQTIGLVALSDFRKRRAEAIEQKDRDAQEAALGSGRSTPASDDALKPKDPDASKRKKKARRVQPSKLSFDDESDDGDGIMKARSVSGDASPASASPAPETGKKGKIGRNANVAVTPKALTKAAMLRDAQTRESLRKEFLQRQEAVKVTEICIPFVFYDGTNLPGGTCRLKKGDYVWLFLDRSRKVGANRGGAGKPNNTRQWARIGVDDLLMVRGDIIIPHHYDFYYFIINRTAASNGRILFNHSDQPPAIAVDAETLATGDHDPLARLKKEAPLTSSLPDAELEGAHDDPTFTKVVDRRWYERNKHIFPASLWQEFDPEKDYQKEIKRDAGGNAFFFT